LELGTQGIGDIQSYVGLNREDVSQVAVVSLSPNVFVACAVDKLRDDPHSIARPPNATFEQRRSTKLLAWLGSG